MSYVIAAYISVFGALGLYAGRLFVRARHAAASVLREESVSTASDSV